MSGSWNSGWMPGDTFTAAELGKSAGAFFDSVLVAAAASFDINPLPTWGSHLLLLAYLRGDENAQFTWPILRFNGAVTGYYFDGIGVNGATVGNTSEGIAADAIRCGRVPAATAAASGFGVVSIDIPNFRYGVGMKSVTAQSFSPEILASGGLYVQEHGGLWANNAAITRITLLPLNGANWVAGSRLTAYVYGP